MYFYHIIYLIYKFTSIRSVWSVLCVVPSHLAGVLESRLVW